MSIDENINVHLFFDVFNQDASFEKYLRENKKRFELDEAILSQSDGYRKFSE